VIGHSSSWPEVALGEICEFRYGKSLPEEKRSGGSIPVYGSNGIVGQHNDALTDGAAIIIGRKGSFGEVHLSERPCWPIDTTYFIDQSATNVDLRWLSYRLKGLGLNRLNKAAAIPGLNREDAYRQRLKLPPLTEQRRIAEILDRAETLRAKRRAAFAQLNSLTQSIFLDLFGDPIANPKRWEQKFICEIGKVITGNTPPRANLNYYGADIEWIKSDNINTPNYYLTKAAEGLSKAGKAVARIAPAGSILVTCIAGSPECIGNAALTDREVAFNQQINALVPFEGNSHFLYAQLLVGKRLVQGASTSGMKGLVSKGRFEQIKLIYPPVPLQREFADRVAAVEKLQTAQRASLAELDSLFASLQHRAFRGEL
jgi:type I restriction enzyme S subunit